MGGPMFHKLVGWLRKEAHPGCSRNRLARWVGCSWARMHYAVRVEPTWLEITHHTIPLRDLPAGFAGFRIIQLSDLHGSKQVTPAYLNEAVELALSQRPDLIALTGDFIHKGFTHISGVARTLGRLRAPHGVYAVLGNHDFSVRNALGIRRHPHLHRAVADALMAQGIRVLRNETVQLTRGGEHLHISGVDDLWSRACDLDRTFLGVCSTQPRVLLAHNPCTIERLAQHRCDLMLSGHTHGGQINLPGLGRVTLTRKGRRYAAGLYQVGDAQLYVNKGVGFGFKVRYGVRPEVAVLTLRQVGD